MGNNSLWLPTLIRMTVDTMCDLCGGQRSNKLNNTLWSEESLMQVYENDDLLTFMEVKGQKRSNIVKLYVPTPLARLQNFFFFRNINR